MEKETSGELARISITEIELEMMISRAAEAGARKALHDIGLHDEEAAGDVRELRDLLDAWRDARHTAWQTVIKVATTGILASLLVGAAIKLKILGGPQ